MLMAAIKLARPKAIEVGLLGLTLITSAIHFVDNALRLDLYPGPAWLTRDDVLGAWIVLFLLALLAYRSGSRAALILYGFLGFVGFAHYLAPHHASMPLRCSITITAEAVASLLLIGYAAFRPQLEAHDKGHYHA